MKVILKFSCITSLKIAKCFSLMHLVFYSICRFFPEDDNGIKSYIIYNIDFLWVTIWIAMIIIKH